MADIATPAWGNFIAGYVAGRARTPSELVAHADLEKSEIKGDSRFTFTNWGQISDRVVLKTGPSTEVGFPNAMVWLLRVSDGRKAWAGFSDADGYYIATGLEVGVSYVPVAMDREGNQKAVAAGPVVAV